MTVDELRAIGKRRDPADLPRLIQALSDSESRLREQAAVCLGWLHSPATTAPLVVAAQADPEAAVRAAALRALGVRKDPQSASAVRAGLKDPDARCVALALRLAGYLNIEREAVAAAVSVQAGEAAEEACRAAGRQGLVQCRGDLWDRFATGDEGLRRAAGVAWCSLAQADHLPTLRDLLADVDPDVRVSALHAVERLRPAGVADWVAPLVDDPHPAVARVAEAIVDRLATATGPPSSPPSPR